MFPSPTTSVNKDVSFVAHSVSSTPPHLLYRYISLRGPHQRLPGGKVACTLHPRNLGQFLCLVLLSLLNPFGSKCVSPVASECLRSGPPALGSTQLLAHQEININISIISISNASTKKSTSTSANQHHLQDHYRHNHNRKMPKIRVKTPKSSAGSKKYITAITVF